MFKYVILLLFVAACIAESIPNPSWEKEYNSVSRIGAKRFIKKEAQHARDVKASKQTHSGYEEVARQKEAHLQQYYHYKVAERQLDNETTVDKYVPPEWTCDPEYYNNTDGCDCDCGGPQDPDCAIPGPFIFNCGDSSVFICEDGSCGLVTPPPPEWENCSELWYGTNDGCDCLCGAEDPDCIPGNATIYGCGSANPLYLSCISGYCYSNAPRGWNCPGEYYNATDGCDCNCGIGDPDCAEKSAVVYGCEDEVDSPVECIKGICTQGLKLPARLSMGESTEDQIVGACGKALGFIKHFSSNISRVLPIIVVIKNEDNRLYDVGSFKISASVRKVDPSSNIILAGQTTVNSWKGYAVFDGLIALGKDGDTFYLQFTSDPPLIPVEAQYSVRLKSGNPYKVNITIANPVINEFGFYKVPTNTNISVIVRWMDACGNRVNATNQLNCTAQNVDSYIKYDSICTGIVALNEKYNTTENITDIPGDDGDDGYDGYDGGDDGGDEGDEGDYEDVKRRKGRVNKIIPNGAASQLNFPSKPGNYDVHFNGHPDLEIATTISFQVITQGEYECYALQEPGIVSAKDIQNFHDNMIDNPTKLNLSLTLFSADSDRPNIMKFIFKENPDTTKYHSKLNATYSKWVLSAKHFFVEQDPIFLKVISLALVDVNPIKIEVNLQKPFCKSVPGSVQRSVFGLWVYEMADRYANLATLKYLPQNVTDKAVQSTQDVVCFELEKEFDYTCCGRQTFLNFRFPGDCEVPKISAISIALIILSVIFALVATIYATALVAVFFQQSGVIYTVIEDVQSMPSDELATRRRLTILQIIFGPVLVILSLVQNVVLLDDGPAAFVGSVFAAIAVFWWIMSFLRFFIVYVRVKDPGRRIDEAFFVAVLLLTFFSLFNILLTFAWVALGLLLNPGRVVSYFVGFLTIFSVAVLKVNALAQLLRTAEKGIIKHLLEKNVDPSLIKSDRESKIEDDDKKGAEKDQEPDWEALVTEALELRGPKLTEFFAKNGMENKKAEDSARRIESFRRFRVRFLIGDLIGTLAILTCLIVFILLGVEAFRTKSAAVSSVGSVMEGVAGAGTAANDKLAEKEDTVNNLVGRFAKAKTRGFDLKDLTNDSVAMRVLGN